MDESDLCSIATLHEQSSVKSFDIIVLKLLQMMRCKGGDPNISHLNVTWTLPQDSSFV